MSQKEDFAMLIEMLESVQQFLDESDYTDATIYSYGYALKRFADWLDQCGLNINDVDVNLVSRFLRDHEWSNNMRRLYGNAIKSFFRYEFGQKHPVCSMKLPKDNAAPGRSLDVEQLDDLLITFDTSKPIGWRDLSAVGLMVESGIRESELCHLEMKHLDLVKRRFDVLAKGQEWREGVFSEVTAQYLDVWLTARKNIAKKGVPYVFVGIGGNTPGYKMTAGGLRANFRKYGLRSGVGELSPHDLRRTMVVLLTEAGAPTRLVQKLGAWDDIRMVVRYSRNLKPSQIDQYSPIQRSAIALGQ